VIIVGSRTHQPRVLENLQILQEDMVSRGYLGVGVRLCVWTSELIRHYGFFVETAMELLVFGVLWLLARPKAEFRSDSNHCNAAGSWLYLMAPVHLFLAVPKITAVCLIPQRAQELLVTVLLLNAKNGWLWGTWVCFALLCWSNWQFICLLPSVYALFGRSRATEKSISETELKPLQPTLPSWLWASAYFMVACAAWAPLIVRYYALNADISNVLSFVQFGPRRSTTSVHPGFSIWWYLQVQLFAKHVDYFDILLAVQPFLFSVPIFLTVSNKFPFEAVSLPLLWLIPFVYDVLVRHAGGFISCFYLLL
jgi:hypothetical protein